jgi:hypothetical protein
MMYCPHCQNPLLSAAASDFLVCVVEAKTFILETDSDTLRLLPIPPEANRHVFEQLAKGEKKEAFDLWRKEDAISQASVRATLLAFADKIQRAMGCSDTGTTQTLQTHRIMFFVMAILSLVSFFAAMQFSMWLLLPAILFFLFMLASLSISRRMKKAVQLRTTGGTLLRGEIREVVAIGLDKTGTGQLMACVVAVQLPDSQAESLHLQLIHLAESVQMNVSDAWVMRWHGGEELNFDFPMKKF